jgi:hypothetical protein
VERDLRRELLLQHRQAMQRTHVGTSEANEHREFISGKKNGKLNKVMKSANVKIKFETFNVWKRISW